MIFCLFGGLFGGRLILFLNIKKNLLLDIRPCCSVAALVWVGVGGPGQVQPHSRWRELLWVGVAPLAYAYIPS